MLDFMKESRDGSTFVLENVPPSAIMFFNSWEKSSNKKKKETIEIIKKVDSDVTKSTTKLIKELDLFLEKHYDILVGTNRKDVVRV